ncbi:MAG: hypothetical protein AAF360_19225 [Pseudomonadota bacterium]
MNLSDVDLRLPRIFRAIVESDGLVPAEARLNVGRSTTCAHLAELVARLSPRGG